MIQITRDMVHNPNSQTRPTELIGTPEQISKTEQMVTEVLAEVEMASSGNNAPRKFRTTVGGQTFIMKVPNNQVGLVIGKGGETIKSMQAKSGARIQNGNPTSLVKMTWLGNFSWVSYNEDINSLDDSTFTKVGLVEQINMTEDKPVCLWYTTYVNIDETEKFLHNGQYPVITVNSADHSLHVFIKRNLAGTVLGNIEDARLKYSENVKLWAASNIIAILSVAVGLPNVGEHFETWNAGVLGPVTLDGLNEGRRDLTYQKWTYQIGLKGEALSVSTLSGSSSVEWRGTFEKQPLTWYKAFFNAPGGSGPLALDMETTGKGQIWINGEGIR